jgi:hypothetical protein
MMSYLHSIFCSVLTNNSFLPGFVIVDHVLKQILPPGLEVPSSFETIVKYSVYVIYIVCFIPCWLIIICSHCYVAYRLPYCTQLHLSY